MAENKKPEQNKPFKNLFPQGGNDGKKTPRFNFYWIYGLLMLLIIASFLMGGDSQTEEVSWQKLSEIIQKGDAEKITVIKNRGIAKIYLTKESREDYPNATKGSRFSTQSQPEFIKKFGTLKHFEEKFDELKESLPEDKIIEPSYEEESDWFSGFLIGVLPIAIIIIFWIYMMRRMSGGAGGGAGGGGGIFSVGKSKAKLFDKESKINVSFKDVAGLAEAKQEIEEIVAFLKHPDRYTKLGGKIPKGALLVGPPGTGKTLLAKAVAGEADVPFFSMSGSDFVEMFVGVGASRVRDLFRQAKAKAPCIIFIDEIDAIGRARGKNPNMGSNDERENTLNQLLTEMDGFDTNSGVIILAATNRADMLDSALMRAGRFDRQIHIDLPNLKEREEIFKVHLRPLKLGADVDVKFLAKQTPGFSGADIANVCNEAALIAARGKKNEVTKQDFLDAVDRIIGGLERKSHVITESEKRRIAYHEAGHATISWLLEHAHPLVKVTIVPRGKALGAAWYLPEERQITTKEQLLDEMCAVLGGRAAEENVFGNISTGAQNDLEKVTKQAYAMISIYGMSPVVGNFSYYDSTGQSDYSFSKPYSEETAQKIDAEAKKMIEKSYERAKKILADNAEGHEKLAKLLLEKEVVFSEDLEQIFGKREFNKETLKDKKDTNLIANAMDKDWITVYEANKRYQVELMKNHLDTAGIESIIIDQTDSSFAGTVGELFEAQLKVLKEDEQNARDILKKYNE
ncbi:cell division protease FtsH [Balneicella halophila]|uniref:ATP-dependent zinc metalloprotease FtsH n=1 Tax=Balneicella halophila TaxID=1537566 RepID=A0A7L4UMM7_BALHA|nr:ATP-dependent zinc metalloprotease FtsH [Balneicella halophila]PVX49876.1 cell division protease FtsH [Balneicella halophila]